MSHKQPIDVLTSNGIWQAMADDALWYETPMDLQPWARAPHSPPKPRHVAWVAVILAASLAVLLFV